MRRVWIVVLAAITAAAVPASGADPTKPNDSQRVVSHIPREPVHSTAIAKVGYSKRRHILEIEFVNGAIYRYLDVSTAVSRNLMSAESKARFYDLNIRGHYRSVRVRPSQQGQSEN
jgi:hypothetical protein